MTPTTPDPYVYRLRSVAKVVDGDTVDLDLDLGFSIILRQRVRLIGIDAPEVRTRDAAEKQLGHLARDYVIWWLERPGQVLVRTTKEEKYGRMLADCFRVGEPSLCTMLPELGLAVPYQG
jgi:micrococcal nuclease